MISIVAALCSCCFMPASIIRVVPTQAAVFPILNTGQDIKSAREVLHGKNPHSHRYHGQWRTATQPGSTFSGFGTMRQ
jgi:hypothetical protein